MCGDEGYECQDGRVVEYENLRQCGPMDPGPDPNSPCSDTSARAEAFSLSASSAEGAVLGVTQACTSANGWGDCDGGTVTVELESVPWDQALDQILKINNLGYELDGNIMRCLLYTSPSPRD